MDPLTRLSNFALGTVQNAIFRVGYSPQAMRRNFDLVTGVSRARLKVFHSKAQFEPVQIGELEAEWITADPTFERAVLYLHGGGYFMGSILSYRKVALKISQICQAKVLLPAYRLAPEHPYPAALDDALAAYKYMLAVHPPRACAVGGDSAGGGLTLATFLAARDRGLSLPHRLFTISAWTDFTGSGRSLHTNADKDVWLKAAHLEAWAPWYLSTHDRRDPYISPLFGDYRDCPPLLMFVGDQETLLDDTLRVAEAVKAGGGHAQVCIGHGMQHDWFTSLPWLSESQRAVQVLERFFAE